MCVGGTTTYDTLIGWVEVVTKSVVVSRGWPHLYFTSWPYLHWHVHIDEQTHTPTHNNYVLLPFCHRNRWTTDYTSKRANKQNKHITTNAHNCTILLVFTHTHVNIHAILLHYTYIYRKCHCYKDVVVCRRCHTYNPHVSF